MDNRKFMLLMRMLEVVIELLDTSWLFKTKRDEIMHEAQEIANKSSVASYDDALDEIDAE